jgi:hypothetical protein
MKELSSREENSADNRGGLSVPFRLFSKRWEGEGNKERRQERPAVVALISESLSSETDPAGMGLKKEHRRSVQLRRCWGQDKRAVFGSSPQPSGLPEPAGRFHRGATRGELDSRVSGGVEESNA